MMAAKHGTGSIYREGNRWRVQVRYVDPLTGEYRKVRRTARTRDQARALLAELKASGAAGPRPTSTLAGFLDDYAARRLPNTSLAPKTKAIYADMLNWYAIPAAGKVLLIDFTPQVAEQWLSAVRATKRRDGQPISEATVRKVYNVTVKALDSAVSDGLLATNPLRSVDRPAQTRVPVPVASADHTYAAIEATKDLRIGPLVVLVAYTGLRLGEALGLRWTDIDLEAQTVTVRRSAASTNRTKTGKVRTITLLPEAVEALRAVKVRQATDRLAVGAGWQNRSGLVFTTVTGAPIDSHNARRDLRSALLGAGLDPARPWHAFRHGLATRLLQQGVPMPVVSAILGHSGIQITVDTYGHLDAVVPVHVMRAGLPQDSPGAQG